MVIEQDRYDSEILLKKWEEADKSNRTIVVEGIEIEKYEKRYNEMIISFLKNISLIDNQIQQFCMDEHGKSELDMKNYLVDMSWILLEENKINIGYWGRFVNIELRATCVFIDNTWNVVDIYFQ